ncbi:MAG: leucine-rich repeat domain-containing protein, partial [Clostridia bacterium]|nr:leucine-rich repeat domain-containing protein [Clostridia bacterium]
MMIVMALCVSAFAADGDFKHMPDYFAVGKYSGSEAAEMVVPAKLNGEDTPIFYADSFSTKVQDSMASFTLSNGITQLRDMNLYGVEALTKVSLPDTLEMIGRHNFYQADSLKEITILASVAYMGPYCLSFCDVLTKVTFTGLCPYFGPECFKSASADLIIYVPSDQVDAYKAALPEGLNIQSSGKKAVVSRGKVTEKDFTFDSATGTITGYTGKVGCFEIPATIGGVQVKAIGKEAFYKNPFIVAVTLPEGLETIELSAFAGSSALARVNFPSSLKTIGKYAFNGTNLDSLTLAEGLETISDSAFTSAFGIVAVDEIVIPNTVTTIGKKAFNSNKGVRIVLGENLQSVGNEAFASSSELKEIVILNKNLVTFAGDAFTKCTNEATLTLPDGVSQDVYNEYVTLMTMLFPTCAVLEPANMEMGFPALDVMAGMPFFGSWHAVAGKDVMGDFTDNYPVAAATLNPDGTAAVNVDGVDMPSAWYVTEGYAILAPVENGKPNEANAYCYACIGENGRLVMDFGYAAAICEQEGKIYAAPAVPEKPWPEFDLENAKYFIGVWQTADGAMTLTLNDDGTATSAEVGEEPYALQWYTDYGTAYVGPAMSELAKVTFDGNGNIKMSMGGDEIILAPYVEQALIEGADELL